MSTQFDAKRTLSTGDLVISVSEILDRLQTKVDPNTLEQLLRDILAGRRNQVRPGELITAELINQILAELESLQGRVTKLESGTVVSTPTIAITDIKPAGPYKVNQPIQVVGRNFGVSTGAVRASVDSVPVTALDSNSTNELLIFNIPVVTGLPADGKPVDLLVQNGLQQASRKIDLQPFIPPQRGSANLQFLGVEAGTASAGSPATITPGAAAFFRYSLKSLALLRGTFLVAPTFSEVANLAEWQSASSVLNTERAAIASRQIDLDPEQETTLFVRINPVPATPAGVTNQTFKLKVEATSPGVSPGVEGPREFPVGVPAPAEDASITLSSTTANNPAAISGTTIRLAPGAFVVLTLNLNFTQIGSYDLSTQLTGATNWTAAVSAGGLNPIPVTVSPDRQGAQFVVSANAAGASASGQVEFRIQRRGATNRKTFFFTLARL